MDAIHVIYEKIGVERIARLFRTYWLLLLIIKQVMFSLFPVEPVIEPAPLHSKENKGKEITAAKKGKENFSCLDHIRVLLTLAQFDPHMLIGDPDQILNPTPPTHVYETL